MRLTPEEGRVIGSLIEKQLTTPTAVSPDPQLAGGWPCNQSSNREPVVSYDERVVQTALASLRNAELIGLVYPSHGRSVTRYRHVLTERLGLDDRELALLAVLLLRGPQTAGELRARSERMAGFDGIDAVDADLVRLSEKTEPLVIRQPRRPGQKEERWAQLLSTATSAPAANDEERRGPRARRRWPPPPPPTPTLRPTALTPAGDSRHARRRQLHGPPATAPCPPATAPAAPRRDRCHHRGRGFHLHAATDDRLASLADEVAYLRAEVSELRDAVDLLRAPAGRLTGSRLTDWPLPL